MPAEDTVFSVLYDKFMWWSIVVGLFTFGWMFLAMAKFNRVNNPNPENIDHIEVGSFPVERHHTMGEVAFYVIPTMIVVVLTVLALSSNTAVWTIPDEEAAFNVEVIGKQWFWEYNYEDSLTWEDDPRITHIDVEWGNTLMVHAHESTAVNYTVTIDGVETQHAIDLESEMGMVMTGFDSAVHATVKVLDVDNNLLHTWEHIPVGYTITSAAGDNFVIPCDEDIVLNLHARPHDESNPAYVGVQHAYWVPEWGIKEDLVPGLEAGTIMTFMPDDAGTFAYRCAE